MSLQDSNLIAPTDLAYPAVSAAGVGAPPQAATALGRTVAAKRPSRVRRRLAKHATFKGSLVGLGELVRELPSVLVSAIVHMALILVLAAWVISDEPTVDPLVLAASIDATQTEDELGPLSSLPDPVELAPVDDDELIEQPVMSPDVEAPPAPPAEPETPPGDLLPPSELSALPAAMNDPGAVLSGRDPRYRSKLVESEGGTSETEAAVARGLAWIAAHQNSDGSWSLNRFQHAGECLGQCGNPGVESDTAGTALALLPFLGAGQTHLRGEYSLVVARGLRWLMDKQKSDGDLRGAGVGRMYAHGQAAIALCESYALTRAELLRDPAQRAIDFIVAAQHEEGGWRYEPRQPGDLSVVGWQLMALRSAQMAYLNVPQDTLLKAARFLNSVQASPRSGQFGYMPGQHPKVTMTAEGLLCRQYSGWRHNNPAMRNGVEWLLKNHPPRRQSPNMYYWYYGTQAMHHMGGSSWNEWNDAMRDLLVSMQSRKGHEAGSWTPGGGHDAQGGRLYMTALAVCTLEVYYRHLPLYRRTAGD
jgi:hypothetical protein